MKLPSKAAEQTHKQASHASHASHTCSAAVKPSTSSAGVEAHSMRSSGCTRSLQVAQRGVPACALCKTGPDMREAAHQTCAGGRLKPGGAAPRLRACCACRACMPGQSPARGAAFRSCYNAGGKRRRTHIKKQMRNRLVRVCERTGPTCLYAGMISSTWYSRRKDSTLLTLQGPSEDWSR